MIGRTSRPKPARLAEKLLQIRVKLDLGQVAMAEALNAKGIPVDSGAVSRFETGKREPSLITLLRYARLAKVSVDVLIDDDLDLPKKFL